MATKRTADLRLELGGALAPPLPRRHGVARGEVGRAAVRAARALAALLGPSPPSGFLAALSRPSLLRAIEAAARRWRRRAIADVVHIGIGGSSLGAEVLLRALAPTRGPRVHVLDNVDPDSVAALLARVDLRRALIHVVSKSGGTVETAAGLQILRAALERRVGAKAWSKRCVFTTGRSGALRELATAEGIETLAFPEDVGGRFSVLTASGLFTPALAGVDVAQVIAGARRMRARLVRAAPRENPACLAAAVAFLLDEERGKPVQVLMPYADALEPLSRWFVQLAGESLGKIRRRGGRREHVGPTPLAARGTTDQHSQVQLFVEGPADKLVSFVVVEREGHPVRIPGGAPAPYLRGVSLGALLRAEQRGTAIALARAGRPTTAWRLPRLDGHALGQLLLALETQVACQAALYGIDAYDQPGVEAGKRAAFALIGREGYEAERASIEASEPPEWIV